ncbi:MAG: response regulator [Gemmatimonadetes bacterium]|jgi:chemotaxis family two-component system response regulator Rcp1|nr:response regulator [Gemmatimonadota bacterium]MCC7322904.1 response regulator [Gemmatimonadaceae bacterium]MBK6843840.1 response regulator [Gemmatimonadota bacterium]MBK7831945.1 response regulator [Gemmatimonadota bacterium]MBK8060049.1 response regulator [Gemmatimonadota bacterium]
MTAVPNALRPIRILLVEDNAGDVELIRDTLDQSHVLLDLSVVVDGVHASDFLNRRGAYESAQRPDLILLDLNLPRRSGLEMLQEIKGDPQLRLIPVVVLTSSEAELDIVRSYASGANCYVTKPVNLTALQQVVESVKSFWFTIVRLPVAADT